MIEDRFFEPETIPFDELLEDEYEKYLKDMEDEEGEPLSFNDFKDWYIGAW
jgi:hypothetical protein